MVRADFDPPPLENFSTPKKGAAVFFEKIWKAGELLDVSEIAYFDLI